MECMEGACSPRTTYLLDKEQDLKHWGWYLSCRCCGRGSDGEGSTRLRVPREPDIIDNRITHRAATENWDRLRYHATSGSHMAPATSLAVNKAPTVHQPGSAGPPICFRNVDCHKTGPRSPASVSHEVPEAYPRRALAWSCHQQGNPQTYLSIAHQIIYPGPKALYIWTCCSPSSVGSLQCHTEAHPRHVHGSLYTTGLAKAKGAAAYFVDESAQKKYRGSNCNILVPCCGLSTVEGGCNGPYWLRDMMMMICTWIMY